MDFKVADVKGEENIFDPKSNYNVGSAAAAGPQNPGKTRLVTTSLK